MNKNFWVGVVVGVAGVWAYHKFAPGKGLGAPGSVGSGS
jgi:hypothetical protein